MTVPSHIVLVSAPWASTSRPSLGISLLTALAEQAGFRCSAYYANLRFAARIGVSAYEAMADQTSFFGLDEHLFAVDLFGPDELASDEYLHRMVRMDEHPEGGRTQQVEALRTLRDQVVPAFLRAAADDILAMRPTIVGMTCTFNQTFASVALARRIKQRDPAIRTLLGGPSVHDSMGVALAECFASEIDHVFTGEADESFVTLLEQIAGRVPEIDIPGVTTDGKLRTPADLVTSLDSSPAPDFGAYFADRRQLVNEGYQVGPCTSLPYESSRGCWWGAKHHCTFCGLNSLGMRFRAKSDKRIVRDLLDLSEKYRMLSFMAADNILDFRAYEGLLGQLAAADVDLELFYEIKANVKRRHVRQLARAGVRAVQPGVESFSDHVLQLMDKGVSALQIVQMLKWLSEYSIKVIYNVLVGFPGETTNDYAELYRVIAAITHLPAPDNSAHIVEVHRFSPFHDHPERYGIQDLSPCGFYSHLIPAHVLEAERFAFFFDRSLPAHEPVHAELPRLNELLAAWQSCRTRRHARLGGLFVEVITEDGEGGRSSQVLSGPAAVAFVALDQELSVERLTAALQDDMALDHAAAVDVLDSLERAGEILVVNGRAVSLVPYDRPQTEQRLADWLLRSGARQVFAALSWARDRSVG